MDTTDPRVGSARDNSTGTGLSRVASGSNSSSGANLLATLVPVLIYTALCLVIFITLRRKCTRVYSPRSLLNSLEPHERSPTLPTGWFNWIIPFHRISDTYVLNHSSLDGFLFLRYLKVLGLICGVGIALTWPILLPLHAVGGAGNTELDILTLGNVVNPQWFYAHAALAWVYFGFILYMVCRECIYYINLRQAYLIAPFYSSRLSSRTVLFTCVPQQYLNEDRLRRVLGDSVKRVWIPRGTKELEDLVQERDQTAFRLEKAEVALIKTANRARNRALQLQRNQNKRKSSWLLPPRRRGSPDAKGESTTSIVDVSNDPDSPDSSPLQPPKSEFGPEALLPDVNGSVAAQWVPQSARPRHRPLANWGRKVDTIKWTRSQLKKLESKIRRTRLQLMARREGIMPSVFVEFETQLQAQNAYQALPHHRPLHMSQRFIGVRPFEIIWRSLRMTWWERIIRKFSIQALVIAMIIFWSIPSALVGTISNIQFLASKVIFLSWLTKLPSSVLGIITGVVPALALSLLMSIVPGIVRYCARVAGTPTLTLIELYTQNAYFAFQVVQVFLITTLTSAASATITKILEDPTTAESLLAQNLPKASNFYLCYFLVQSLALGAGSLIQVFNLFRFHVLRRFSTDPRRIYLRWHKMQRIHWGSIFPVYTNLGVITITYSLIAPIILGFAAVGVIFLHLTYRYNLIFVYDSEVDTRGLVYPRALMQTLLGLYFAEVCLIGLFSLRGAFGPMVLIIGLLVFTALINISLLDAVGPLLWSLPKTLTAEDEFEQVGADQSTPATTSAVTEDIEGLRRRFDSFDDLHEEPGEGMTRGFEGAKGAIGVLGQGFKSMVISKIEKQVPQVSTFQADVIRVWRRWISPDPAAKSNFLLRWLHPEVYSDYSVLRQMVPCDLPELKYSEDLEPNVYYPPSFIAPSPCLWIPRDPAGVSRQEVAHTGKVIPITDEHANLDENYQMTVDLTATRDIFNVERLRY